jgi:hypothetical protein
MKTLDTYQSEYPKKIIKDVASFLYDMFDISGLRCHFPENSAGDI